MLQKSKHGLSIVTFSTENSTKKAVFSSVVLCRINAIIGALQKTKSGIVCVGKKLLENMLLALLNDVIIQLLYNC